MIAAHRPIGKFMSRAQRLLGWMSGNEPVATAADEIGAAGFLQRVADLEIILRCTTECRPFWDAFSLADVLAWIRSCFRLLETLLRPDVYSWTRSSGYSNVGNVMNVDGMEVSFLMENNQPVRLPHLHLTISPKAGFVREARELAAACVKLEQRLGIVGKAEESGECDKAEE